MTRPFLLLTLIIALSSRGVEAQFSHPPLTSRDSTAIMLAATRYLLESDSTVLLGPARIICIVGRDVVKPSPWLDRIRAAGPTREGRLVLFQEECQHLAEPGPERLDQANIGLGWSSPDYTGYVQLLAHIYVAIPDRGFPIPPVQVAVSPDPRWHPYFIYLTQKDSVWSVIGMRLGETF